MLVLAHTDRLGIDLDQFRQGILQPSRDRCRAPLSHIELGKLLGRQLARTVHRGARFVDDHILQRPFLLPDEIRDHLLRLPRSRAVANADHGNIVLSDQLFQFLFGLSHLVLRRRRIDDLGVKDPACGVRDREFASRPEGGVPSQDHFAGDGLLHQKLLQVGGEDADRAVLRFLCQPVSDLPLDGGRDQPLVTVPHCGLYILEGVRLGIFGAVRHLFLQIEEEFVCRCLYFDREYVLLLAAVEGENSVSRNPADRLAVVKIHLIHIAALLLPGSRLIFLVPGIVRFRFLLHLLGGKDRPFVPSLLSNEGPEARLIRDLLCDDIHGACDGRLRIGHFLRLIDILQCFLEHIAALVLCQNIVCQALQPSLFGHARAGSPLGPVGEIQILHFHQGLRIFDCCL